MARTLSGLSLLWSASMLVGVLLRCHVLVQLLPCVRLDGLEKDLIVSTVSPQQLPILIVASHVSARLYQMACHFSSELTVEITHHYQHCTKLEPFRNAV